MITVGSLFSGIGGLDLGLEKVGMQVKWQVENNEFCNKILKKHWPEVKRYGDIKEITGKELEKVDLICGGFPCQDISTAGKGAGITGERSGLWFEMLRIISVVRPRYVLVENLPALFGRGMGVVLGGLVESGYNCEWDCIPTRAIGAPHRRDRVFIVAYTGQLCRGENERGTVEGFSRRKLEKTKRESKTVTITRPSEESGIIPHGNGIGCIYGKVKKHTAKRGEYAQCNSKSIREDVPDTEMQGSQGNTKSGNFKGVWENGKEHLTRFCEEQGREQWAVEPELGRVAHGVSDRVDRIKALGNAVVPQVAEYIGQMIMEFDNGSEQNL